MGSGFAFRQSLRESDIKPEGKEISRRSEVVEVAPPPVSKELKKRWSYFIRKVYETDPLACPKCQGEMWFDPSIKLRALSKSKGKLTNLRKPEGRIITLYCG